MAQHSPQLAPQRGRKAVPPSIGVIAGHPRDATPSPTFRDSLAQQQQSQSQLPPSQQGPSNPSAVPRTVAQQQPRVLKASSMPLVPSMNQVLASASDSAAAAAAAAAAVASQQPRPSMLRAGTQQPSPTTSTSSIQSSSPPQHHQQQLQQSTPPPGGAAPQSPPGPQALLAQAPPPPLHTFSHPNLHALAGRGGVVAAPPGPQHTHSDPNLHAGAPLANPRAIRVPPPPFLSAFPLPPGTYPGALGGGGGGGGAVGSAGGAPASGEGDPDAFAPAPGAGGVAYAGGAVSNKIVYPIAYDPVPAAPRQTSQSQSQGPSPQQPQQQQQQQQQQRHSPQHSRSRSGSGPLPGPSTSGSGGSANGGNGHRSSPSGGAGGTAPAIYGPGGAYDAALPYRPLTPSTLRRSTLPSPGPDEREAMAQAQAHAQAAAAAAAARRGRSEEDRHLPFREEPEEDAQAAESSSSASTSTQRWTGGGGGGAASAQTTPQSGGSSSARQSPQTHPAAARRQHSPHVTQAPQPRRGPAPTADRGASPTPSSDTLPEPGYGGRTSRAEYRPSNGSGEDDSDDVTLNEQDESDISPRRAGVQQQQQQQQQQHAAKEETPRSPTADLPDVGGGHYATVRAKRASTENIRAFDPKMFEATVDALRMPQSAQAQQEQQQQQYMQQMSAHARQKSYPPLAIPQQQALLQHQLLLQQQQLAAHLHPQSFFSDTTPMSSEVGSNLYSAYGAAPSVVSSAAYSHSQPRPDAPVPPTPSSQTAAPSPSPLLSAIVPPEGYSSVEGSIHSGAAGAYPPAPSPYPYPYEHVRRQVYAPPISASAPSPSYDLMLQMQAQMAQQMRLYALNNMAMTDASTLSPAGTPYPSNIPGQAPYEPWKYLQTSRVYEEPAPPARGPTSMSLRSSPSHEPVQLPLPPRRGRPAPFKRGRFPPPPRVESTQPRDTSPEPSSGEETAGEEMYDPAAAAAVQAQYAAQGHVPLPHEWAGAIPVGGEGVGEWAVEEDEGEWDEDLLELEFHPSYVNGSEKRRRRWEARWDALVKAFQDLDRETDSTLVLLAAPNVPGSTGHKLRMLTSRSIRRDPSLLHAPAVGHIRSSFTHMAAQRAASRTQISTLAERLASHASEAGSDAGGGGGEREEELRRMLGSALGSLNALGAVYEQREARWRAEMRRLADDRETVEMLLRQALGAGMGAGLGVTGAMPTMGGMDASASAISLDGQMALRGALALNGIH